MNREKSADTKAAVRTIDIVKSGLTRRYRAERRFRFYGLSAIILSILFLALLFTSIVGKGYSAFRQTHIKISAPGKGLVPVCKRIRRYFNEDKKQKTVCMLEEK